MRPFAGRKRVKERHSATVVTEHPYVDRVFFGAPIAIGAVVAPEPDRVSPSKLAQEPRAGSGKSRCFLAGIAAMSILAGRGWADALLERATVEQADDGTHCHVRFRGLNREIPCDEVASAIQSELHVPTVVQLVLQPAKGTRYEDVARLLESLRSVRYLRVGSINAVPSD